MNHQGTKTLTAERLTLRRFTVEDAPAMFGNWCSDPEVTKYVLWEQHRSVEETKTLLTDWCGQYEKPTFYNWGIEWEGQLIGNVSVVGVTRHGQGEIGYCLGSRWWGWGFMTEAVSAVVDYLFEEVGMHRLVIRYETDNPGSAAVARKCGFTPEGIHREEIEHPAGHFCDVMTTSLLRSEWEKKKMGKFLTLDTPRLTLRPADTGDFETVHSWAGDPENTQFLYFGTNTPRQTRQFLEDCERLWAARDQSDYEFVMVLKETGEAVGSCSVGMVGQHDAELGWILNKRFWKRGLAAEAGQAMRDFAFRELGVHRVLARCDAENYGSRRVMEKLGMRREAHFLGNRPWHGEWHDELEYAVLREEWEGCLGEGRISAKV